ncbi:hypothetical protein CDAR_120791 [Caerostris darwini]|uniref:Uncharacterized protein n=1 Tax=Caerostris darwini TaxID=1538125 RepID=A0AAV4RWX9_9ARAC|nr:hypothetical protein CDAR_120791 [Caerostris darwini]
MPVVVLRVIPNSLDESSPVIGWKIRPSTSVSLVRTLPLIKPPPRGRQPFNHQFGSRNTHHFEALLEPSDSSFLMPLLNKYRRKSRTKGSPCLCCSCLMLLFICCWRFFLSSAALDLKLIHEEYIGSKIPCKWLDKREEKNECHLANARSRLESHSKLIRRVFSSDRLEDPSFH